MAGRVYECENGDKCTGFLSGTSYVTDSALRQVHVTAEQQRKRERGRERDSHRQVPKVEKEEERKVSKLDTQRRRERERGEGCDSRGLLLFQRGVTSYYSSESACCCRYSSR